MAEHFEPVELPIRTLCLDGGGRSLFVGLLEPGAGAWHRSLHGEAPPLECLFDRVAALMDDAGTTIAGLNGFLYNRGPGSVLGLRLAAMAIEVWRRSTRDRPRCFSFDPLRLAAALLMKDDPQLENFTLISEWKRDAWHRLEVTGGRWHEPDVLDNAGLASLPGPCFHLPQRKGWHPPPLTCATLAPQTERLPEVASRADLLRAEDAVSLYQPGEPPYRPWAGRRHR